MTRRCSQCSSYGHNLRTCTARPGGGRLFGVRLADGVAPMKRSASMGCLLASSPNPSASLSSNPIRDLAAGYTSDDPSPASRSTIQRTGRKKGIPWTEEEHRMFLLGLQKLGKGDWRGVARNFVVSRTPTQVASHAQKYFIRQTNTPRRKRRSSLFDTVPEMPKDQLPVLEEQHKLHSPSNESESSDQIPSLHIYQDQGSKSVEHTSSNLPEVMRHPPYLHTPTPMVPAFYPALIPLPCTFWLPTLAAPGKEAIGKPHEVLKPTPVQHKDAVNVEDIVDMSNLSIADGADRSTESSALSFQMLGASSSGQADFLIDPTIAGSGLSQSSSNAIHAV